MTDDTNLTDAPLAMIEATLKRIRIIFLAMCAGQLIFCALAVNLVQSGKAGMQPDLTTTFLIVSSALGIASVAGGGIFARRFLATANRQDEIRRKLNLYTSASIMRWAAIEGSGLFNIIAYMLTGNTAFLIIFVALMMVLAIDRPSGDRLRRDLAL